MKLVSGIVFIALIFVLSTACTRDSIEEVVSECVEEVSYDSKIRDLINSSCAYVGCHAGGAPGNFTTFSGISDYTGSEILSRRVIINRDMPPDFASEGPNSLTDEQIELFKCWIQAGYPEN